ncbi:pilus assembly protein CpaE [Breoghania corrubedonensis]|uniref:Pilus assembly protein CpaE n=1 Tax=Breoghania corrubedonensis TaxID=665038 RepID=A0A2T5VG28_9HYPH|nr:CtpF protein [Breoghania corrubedonensis]PTW62711.1 pilus assembly protein CpaE [Breoghania corrubedonensis]
MNELAHQTAALDTPADDTYSDGGGQGPARADGLDLRPVPRVSIQAFCETPGVAQAIEQASEDRRMAKAHTKVHMGGIAAAVDFYRSAPTPNLIILEMRGALVTLTDGLDALAEVCDAGTKVVVVGETNDIELYRDLMRRGVSEYLVAPIDLFDVIAAISEIFGDPEGSPLGRTIAFIGAKGGCGASTIAHNVSWSIARSLETDVVLADFDLPFGTAGLDFNQDPLQGVLEAVSTPDRLDDMLFDRLLSKCSEHLSILAAPAALERAYDFKEDDFSQLIDIMRQGVPTVVCDVPHMWTSWVQKMLGAADEVVIVAEPDLANLRNGKNLADKLRQLRPNDHAPHLVLNRVGVPKRPEIKPADFAEALELTIGASIPFDPQLFGTAANNGQMIAELGGKSEVCETIKAIAQITTGRREIHQSRRRSALTPLLQKLRGRS